MSLAILTQVYDETRRPGRRRQRGAGGRLPPQEAHSCVAEKVAGAKAPVFARVAQAVQTLVAAKEQESADALLELATLVSAVLYTQGETGAAGTLTPIETVELPPTQTSARMLKPLMEALTTTGPGRLELVRDAYERGAFLDIHLVQPALRALDDVYAEIADFVAEKVLPLYGRSVAPDPARRKYDPTGRAGDARQAALAARPGPCRCPRPGRRRAGRRLEGGQGRGHRLPGRAAGGPALPPRTDDRESPGRSAPGRLPRLWLTSTIGDAVAAASEQSVDRQGPRSRRGRPGRESQ